MMDKTQISDLYNTLRAIGPLSADEVPMRLAQQAMDAGLDEGNQTQHRSTLAKLSRVASHGTLAEFEIAITSRSEPPEFTRGKPVEYLSDAVDSCEGAF